MEFLIDFLRGDWAWGVFNISWKGYFRTHLCQMKHCVPCKIKIPSDSASLRESFPVEMPQDPTTQNPGDAINWNLARSWFAARDRLWVNTVIIIGNWKVHWIDDGSAQHNSIEKAIYQRLVTNDKMIRLCCGNGEQEFQKSVFFFV